MTCVQSRLAWRLFELNWIPLGAMAVALALSVALTDFTVEPAGAAASIAFVAAYAGFAYYNAKAPHRGDPQVVFALGGTAQIVLVTVLMTPLTYVAAAANMPLQDATLNAIDRALGLDWRAYFEAVNERPWLAAWLTYGYRMIRWPIFAIPVVLAAALHFRRLQEFTLAFALALIATTLISALVPAFGVFHQFAIDPATYPHLNPAAYVESSRELPLVRDGTLRHLNLFALTGLVTFPSFHAASAVLFAWALWPVRWIRPFAVFANVAMLASTPVDGAHYFIDIIAGVAVAAAAIAAAKAISARALGAADWQMAKVAVR